MARISDVVKTYKLINDPDAPNWSVKFVGAVAGALLLLAGAGAVVYTATHHAADAAPNQVTVASTQNADGTRTDRIFLANFDPSLAPDYARLDQQLAAWQQTHPGAQILSETQILDDTRTHPIGYEIVYR